PTMRNRHGCVLYELGAMIAAAMAFRSTWFPSGFMRVCAASDGPGLGPREAASHAHLRSDAHALRVPARSERGAGHGRGDEAARVRGVEQRLGGVAGLAAAHDLVGLVAQREVEADARAGPERSPLLDAPTEADARGRHELHLE